MLFKNKNDFKNNNSETKENFDSLKSDWKSELLTKSLDKNIKDIKNIFKNDGTLMIRNFDNRWLDKSEFCIIYLDGMVNNKIVNESIINPVLQSDLSQKVSRSDLFTEIQKKILSSNKVSEENKLEKIIMSILHGDTAFLAEGFDKALIIDTKGWKSRSIEEPESERVVRGPREGFTEAILTNITLIRRKIKNPDLKFQFREIGVRTHTDICVCYLDGVASAGILKELQKRLDQIEIDGIIDSGYIQELIRDAPFTPFETVGYSERPDVIAARLLEGRIAIIVDGSPVVLTVPYVMVESVQANEDYYSNYIYSSFNRFIRSTGVILAVTVPSIYLALVTYHQEMLPTSLLLSISAARKGVPIPTVLSMAVMLLIFDVLREAGSRMPASIGQAVNIVGTLVLGQAAVEAKLVSAPIIIVTALSGILTLMNINLIGAIIIIRFFLLIITSIFGIYGYILGVIITMLHLMSIRSFGVPYMLGFSRFINHDGQDVWIRVPWWSMTLRPKIIAARNLVRQTKIKTGK